MVILLTGASGQLGAYLIERLVAGGHEVRAWSGPGHGGRRGGVELAPVDLADGAAVERALETADPAAILHAAAVSSAAVAYADPRRAEAVNVEGTARLAAWCAARGRRLLFTSTDLVFDGTESWSREEDPARPVLVYGRTKRDAERAVLAVRGGLVARVGLLYGLSRCGRESFFDRALADLRAGLPRAFFTDEFRTPLHLATAAEALVRLLEGEATGIVHVAGPERMSRHELMRRVAPRLSLDPAAVRPGRQADVPAPEPRPADVSLNTTRLMELLPDLDRPPPERMPTN